MCWSDTIQTEHTQCLVVFCHFTFTLQNMDINGCLVISSSCEDLGFLGWDGGVSLNDLGGYTAESFQTKGQWGNVEQQQAFYFASQNAALDSSTNSNTLIWVDTFEWLFAGDSLNSFL